MKKIVLLVMVVVLVGFAGCSSQDGPKEENGKTVYTREEVTARLLGTWSNLEYMNNLELTKSPYSSVCEVPWIDIRMENKDTMFDEYLNFHEGGTGGRITDIVFSKEKSRYAIQLKDYSEGSALDLKRSVVIDQSDSAKDIIIYTDQQDKEKYSFVKIGQYPEFYANEVVLAGNYVDENGEEYSFTKRGEAIWPDENFYYQIQLDFLGGPTFIDKDGSYYEADYFFKTEEKGVNISNFVYHYEIKNDQLSIFKAYEKEETYIYEIKELPDLVLTKKQGV